MGTLSPEQSEKIILAKERKVTAGLLDALADARRQALIATGMSTSSSSKQKPPVAQREADLEAKLPPAAKPLPRARAYLNDLMDDAKLSEKMRDCYSLKWEHGLKEADIATRLGISRPAVYDRLAAAQRRMDQANANQKARKSAASRPQE